MKSYFQTKCLVLAIGILILWGIIALLERPTEYNCNNFPSYEAALKVFKSHSTDIYHLDGNHNGIPCEVLINR